MGAVRSFTRTPSLRGGSCMGKLRRGHIVVDGPRGPRMDSTSLAFLLSVIKAGTCQDPKACVRGGRGWRGHCPWCCNVPAAELAGTPFGSFLMSKERRGRETTWQSRCREPGAGSREPGAGSREPGTASWEPGTASWEQGARHLSVSFTHVLWSVHTGPATKALRSLNYGNRPWEPGGSREPATKSVTLSPLCCVLLPPLLTLPLNSSVRVFICLHDLLQMQTKSQPLSLKHWDSAYSVYGPTFCGYVLGFHPAGPMREIFLQRKEPGFWPGVQPQDCGRSTADQTLANQAGTSGVNHFLPTASGL